MASLAEDPFKRDEEFEVLSFYHRDVEDEKEEEREKKPTDVVRHRNSEEVE